MEVKCEVTYVREQRLFTISTNVLNTHAYIEASVIIQLISPENLLKGIFRTVDYCEDPADRSIIIRYYFMFQFGSLCKSPPEAIVKQSLCKKNHS